MVSVIIPTYKRSTRLPIAIDSVIAQSYKNIEIIVVDDNNDDDFRKETKKMLKPYLEQHAITYIEHDVNKGGCAARNTGAFKAKGDYIAFLDDDDFYEPTKIQEQIDFLEKNQLLDACMCSMFRIDDTNKQIVSKENRARGTTLKDAVLDGNLFTSMLLIKKDVFLKLNGFSEIPRYQDKYFHYKFLKGGYHIGVLDKQLLTLVEHNDYRISLSASEKIIKALDILHDFEKANKALFSKKEWRFIMHRVYYYKAYTLCQGNLTQKTKSLLNIIKSLNHYTGDFNVAKIAIKALIPNFIANYKNKN